LGSKAIGRFYKNISKCRKFAGLAAKCVGLTQGVVLAEQSDSSGGKLLPFYSKSFALDPIGVSKRLLNVRLFSRICG
jgi:hypothetical protein